jgi:arogenate dehydrogenase (NADP+)
MMAKYNKEAVQQALLTYRQQLDNLMSVIEEDNWDQLEMMLGQTQGARSRFLSD